MSEVGKHEVVGELSNHLRLGIEASSHAGNLFAEAEQETRLDTNQLLRASQEEGEDEQEEEEVVVGRSGAESIQATL